MSRIAFVKIALKKRFLILKLLQDIYIYLFSCTYFTVLNFFSCTYIYFTILHFASNCCSFYALQLASPVGTEEQTNTPLPHQHGVLALHETQTLDLRFRVQCSCHMILSPLLGEMSQGSRGLWEPSISGCRVG